MCWPARTLGMPGRRVLRLCRNTSVVWKNSFKQHKAIMGETWQTLLYSQLQEGIQYNLIKSPAVSEVDSYTQLCIAARHNS